MSREVKIIDGQIVEKVVNKYLCKFLCNGVCCNDSCKEWLADYPTLEDCKRCIFREDEK